MYLQTRRPPISPMLLLSPHSRMSPFGKYRGERERERDFVFTEEDLRDNIAKLFLKRIKVLPTGEPPLQTAATATQSSVLTAL